MITCVCYVSGQLVVLLLLEYAHVNMHLIHECVIVCRLCEHLSVWVCCASMCVCLLCEPAIVCVIC